MLSACVSVEVTEAISFAVIEGSSVDTPIILAGCLNKLLRLVSSYLLLLLGYTHSAQDFRNLGIAMAPKYKAHKHDIETSVSLSKSLIVPMCDTGQ
jgi:hypothetical protein